MTDDGGLGQLLTNPFPEPEPELLAAADQGGNAPPVGKSRSASHRRRRTWTVIGTAVVLLAATTGTVWAATGSSGASYRTAAVQPESIDQTLNSYGTITPVHQATVDFPIAGIVATVPVTVGEHVTAGQPLATLSIASLQAALDQAKSTLATAQAKLVTDTAAEASGTTVSGSSGTAATATTSSLVTPGNAGTTAVLTAFTSKGGSAGTSKGGSAGNGADQAAVTAAQNTLLADQRTVDGLIQQVAADLRSGTSTCDALIASLQNDVTPTPSSAPSATPSGAPTTAPSATVPDTSACTTLLNKVLADQQSVTSAQNTVSNDETRLTAAVSKLLASGQSGQTPTTPTTPTKSPSAKSPGTSGTSSHSGVSSTAGTSGGSGASHSSGGGGTVVTAAQLVVDQATVDADTDAAYVAAEALNQATIVSPLAGTVAAISVKPGASVSAQSAAVTVIGPGVDEVSTTVTDLNLGLLRIGASATITPDGTNSTVHGTVTAIGLLPVASTTSGASSGRSASAGTAASSSSSSTSSTTTYPVKISLDTSGLESGSGADVAILVKQVAGVLAVPTSAVTALGTRDTVTVVQGGKATRTLVTIGAHDPTYTQITIGLKKGQDVALAQLNLAVPTSGSTTLSTRALGGTRTGGAGFGAGGGAATGVGRATGG